jgi:hypothetical protein
MITIAMALFMLSFNQPIATKDFKCMIQLKNYEGEGAYVIVSLINREEGEYVQTLYVQGEDHQWFNEITEWWKFFGKRRPNIDAITGATVGGGERTISQLKIPSDKIDAGYNLRFETAVEDQEYHTQDVQFELTTDNLSRVNEGKGFIRYVRIVPQ